MKMKDGLIPFIFSVQSAGAVRASLVTLVIYWDTNCS